MVTDWKKTRITHDLYGLLVAREKTFKESPVSVDQMRGLLDLLENGQVTGMVYAYFVFLLSALTNRDSRSTVCENSAQVHRGFSEP